MTERNSTSFAVQINEIFKKIAPDSVLKPHQQYTIHYANEHSLLVMHDLGTGKSLVAAGIIAKSTGDQVIFLSPKSLHGNLRKTLDSFQLSRDPENADEASDSDTDAPAELPETGKSGVAYVTMNASNMLTQIKKVVSPLTFDDKLKVASTLDLSNRTLIVDEAHNLFNSITNGSANALGLYNAVMRAKNLRVIFLTGTPIVNHPFELVPCFNMIAREEVLPTGWEDFNNYFVDMNKKTVKNRSKFQNRIVGLASYYGRFYTTTDRGGVVKKEHFPDQLATEVVRVPMSQYQYGMYCQARDAEMAESTAGSSAKAPMLKPQGVFTSSYRRLSRQFSNLAYPSYAYTDKSGHLVLKPEALDDRVYKDLGKYSPKIEMILADLNTTPGKHLVYSAFVENAGVDNMANAMKQDGWVDAFEPGIGRRVAKKSFIRITGDVDPDARQSIVDRFNKPANMMGDDIKVILISGAGAEGLDLKDIGTVHIMEPYWNQMRLDQVIGRAVRYKSHDNLPPRSRRVRSVVYLADYPRGHKPDKISKREDATTDVTLYENAQMFNIINREFYIAIAESAIDCAIHNRNPKLHCRVCTPTGERLFIPDFQKDIHVRSPCRPLSKKSVKATEILIDDNKYAYYVEDKELHILKWAENLGSYKELMPGDPDYVVYKTIAAKVKL